MFDLLKDDVRSVGAECTEIDAGVFEFLKFFRAIVGDLTNLALSHPFHNAVEVDAVDYDRRIFSVSPFAIASDEYPVILNS